MKKTLRIMNRFNSFTRTTCLVLALMVLSSASAQAEPVDQDTFASTISQWNSMLDFPELLLSDPGIRAQELERLSKSVNLVIQLARKARKQAEVDHARQQKLLEALGPPPGEYDAPEAADVAKQRASLADQVAYYDARIKQTKVISARAGEILGRISDREVSIIANILGRRLSSPLAPATVMAGIREYPDEVREFFESIGTWWRGAKITGGLSNLDSALIALCVSLVVVLFLRRRLSRYGMVPKIENPTLGRRFVAIIVEALSSIVLPILLIGGAAMIFISNAGFPQHLEANFTELVKAIVDYILVVGLAGVSLTSAQPQWRITRFTDDSAASLQRDIGRFAMALLIISILLVLVNPEVGQASSLRIVDFATTTKPVILVATVWILAGSLLTLKVLRPANWWVNRKSSESDEITAGPMSFNLKVLFALAKVLIVAGVLMYFVGYLNLGLYILSRTIVTLGVIAIAFLLHGAVREGLRQATSEENPIGRWIQKRFALEEAEADRWRFWLVLLFDVLLVIALLVFLLNVWGVPWTEIKTAFLGLVYGAEIGGHTFSLINVGLALGTFILLMLIVRLLRGVLSNRILVQTRLDVGVRDAVTAGVGYVGVVVAALVALSLVGFDFGDIALIFGALSIGIGFGLQHVVNNFISGLILLVQRPIKAGDWIVVGSGVDASEGYVKRINVISTEITTFDNATIIVPNNQLMTMEVMNWTHRGRLGRVRVPIGVSYSSEPEKVREILMRCARENASVLSRPAPTVIFKAFGESSLDFELRVFIRDIDYVFNVASELRFAVKKALDEAGIEIPFPQRDVHVKSMPLGSANLPA